MSFLTGSIAGSLVAVAAFMTPAPAAYQVSVEEWQPRLGDRFVVDTLNNEGYLIHTDGQYIRFPVITGQRRRVYYIGRSYNAATPNWDWEAKSKDIKGDRVTFGPTGRFVRLYKDGEETAYGIHEHKSEEVMFARDIRYQSMGCVIVKTAMMDIIEQTYELNAASGGFTVLTRYGVEDAVALAFPPPPAQEPTTVAAQS